MARHLTANDIQSVNFLSQEEDDQNRLTRTYNVIAASNNSVGFTTNSILRVRHPDLPYKGQKHPEATNDDMTYVVKARASQTGGTDQAFKLVFTYDRLDKATQRDSGLGGGGNSVKERTLMPWQERAVYSESGRTMNLKLPIDAKGRVYQVSTGRPVPNPPSRPIPITVIKIKRNRRLIPGNIATDSRLLRKEYYKKINNNVVDIGGENHEPETLLVAQFNIAHAYYTYRDPIKNRKKVVQYFSEEVELWKFEVDPFNLFLPVGWPLLSSILDEGYVEFIDKANGVIEGNYKPFKDNKNTKSPRLHKLDGGGKFLLNGDLPDLEPAPGVDIEVFQQVSTENAVLLRFDDYKDTNFNTLNLNERLF